jgi:hypothetical protein
MAIEAEECHAITFRDAASPQCAGEPAYALGKLRVSEPLRATHNCCVVGILITRISKEPDRR